MHSIPPLSALVGPAHYKKSSTGETAAAAARAVTPSAPTMRARVLKALIDSGVAMSAEEITGALEVDGKAPLFTSIRSRLSDLKALGLVTDSGERAKAYGGCRAIRWRLVPAAIAAPTTTTEGATDDA